MGRSKLLIIVSLAGWAALLIVEACKVSVPINLDSIKWVLTVLLVTGIVIPVLEQGFRNIIPPLANGFEKNIVPTLERGFENVAKSLAQLELSPEIRDVVDYLSRDVRYIDFSRTFELEEQGHAIVTCDLTVKNISEELLPALTLPPFTYDIGEHSEEEEFEQLIELLIDGRRIERKLDSILASQAISEGSTLPHVQSKCKMEAVYRIPVTLEPKSVVRVVLKVRHKYCMENMYNFEIAGARIHEITEKLTLKVKAPAGFTIRSHQTADYPKGVMVVHLISKQEHRDEMNRVLEPQLLNDKELYWQAAKPIIGYGYGVRFQVVSPGAQKKASG